jgi:anaerobic selenocysteine-containing dehydrogenase
MTMKDEKGNYLLELFVVTEILPSETMKWADLVLPDQTNFERWSFCTCPGGTTSAAPRRSASPWSRPSAKRATPTG